MNIKDAEKVIKIINKIKSIDESIIAIEKLALQAANDDIDVDMKFSVTDFTPVPMVEVSDNSEASLSFDWSYHISQAIRNHVVGSYKDVKKEIDNTKEYKESVNNSIAMQIFGLLILDKQNKRTKLLQSLTCYGVTI